MVIQGDVVNVALVNMAKQISNSFNYLPLFLFHARWLDLNMDFAPNTPRTLIVKISPSSC